MKTNRKLIIALALVTVLLAISLAFNVIFFDRGRQYYLQLNAVRLDPLGLNAYSVGEEPRAPKPTVVFFGDSRAAQWPPPAGLDRFEFVNRGIGSQTSTQVVGRYDDHVAPLHPTILVVQVCINDLKTIPLFPHLKASIIQTCKDNLAQIVAKARSQDSLVILTTVFPLGRVPLERRLFWSEDVGEAITEVNHFIGSLQAETVIIFDTVPVLADERGSVHAPYSQDLLHLNEAGYEALNDELSSILNTLAETSALSPGTSSGF